ncbi:uncharacterized protein LOC131883940 [Tigriopus californicus]|uniref:uncharacterized protein LOC131883940 n=1 Tax=Tigriopus californicus TaxID=6832 RepID=UPI0027DA713C|nr:uncharacterized protein LOC131883940 [Tigriopus californicus]|eukprot:TCALIF_00270-PA protein Name:"Protein of unknown function" AED:0.01 eAED:0.01 QI:35/1/1/1/0.5/0.66/3/325/359
MGQLFVILAGGLALLGHTALCSEIAPLGYIPPELKRLFSPEELDDHEHPGLVDRQRRASGQETAPQEYTYTLYSLGGAPCILVQTECIFQLDYRTLRYGVQTVTVQLPKEPEISGSCVREGDTAVLTMHWSVFNFSMIFTENPEGNSYYLNRAILKYNQSLDIFRDATYRGPVILETPKTWNYYFTPLGKSYVCQHGEDQGPLDLYNVDEDLIGNMTLWNSKFQPFVRRAKGDWGPESHCLPKSIQVMREDVAPFVTAGIFFTTVFLLLAGYALYRKFNVKKTTYEVYGEATTIPTEETLEMKGTNGTRMTPAEDDAGHSRQTYVQQSAPSQKPVTQTQNAANPFTNKGQTNPFQASAI